MTPAISATQLLLTKLTSQMTFKIVERSDLIYALEVNMKNDRKFEKKWKVKIDKQSLAEVEEN